MGSATAAAAGCGGPPGPHRAPGPHWSSGDAAPAVAGGPSGPGRGLARRHPLGLAVIAALVQVGFTTLAVRGDPLPLDALGYALLAVGGLALAGRRRFPVATFAVIGGLDLAYQVRDYPVGPTFVALILAGVVAVKAGHRYPVWALTATGYLVWLVLVGPYLTRAVVVAAWIGGILLFSEWVRSAAAYRARAAQVQQERARAQEEQQRRQASEERLRIAQELHDVLGHHLSLINVQAGVGLHLMDSRPEQARAALGTIRQASAEALREVRSVLATFHPAEQAAPRTPSPGLAQLDQLTVDAGLPVRSSVVGRPRGLPAELDRAAYRIVQEALTNVRRHAGAGAAAAVVVEYQEDGLVVQVDDDGGDAGPVDGAVSEGGGIGGMRERVAAFGGTLTTRPLPGGGFQVRVRLPLPAETAP